MIALARRVSEALQRPSLWDNQDPIREELFSVERLEEHAQSLALAQIVTTSKSAGRPLAGRLASNGAALLSAYRGIVQAINEGRAMTTAAEWLVDNYYLVERHIRELRSDMPPGYYRQLPKLAGGPFAGYPRVFGLTWAFVAHTDSCFDSEMLVRYVLAYQGVQPLTIGELWAISITLRIVLVENLTRLSKQIALNLAARRAADGMADRLLGANGRPAESVAVVLATLERAPISEALAVQLIHRLRDQDPKITPALTWLDERLSQQQTTAEDAVREVHRRQGAANVTVRNIIASLRVISDVDWQQFFERVSLVDVAFAADSQFEDMDFATRTLYRSAVEELARGSTLTELQIAEAAVQAARSAGTASDVDESARRGDPGYHLLNGGRRAFEAAIAFRPTYWQGVARLNRSFGLTGYVAAIAAVSLVLLALPLFALAKMGLNPALLTGLGILGAIPASDAAIALVNRGVNATLAAVLLPALELRAGVPSELRTLVAVPTMLTSLAAIDEHIERLEVHHLASPEGDLHFALVSDWTDNSHESADDDAELLAAAAAGIARLNLRYGSAPAGARFLLLHRRRVWSESELSWIGWERKRGKLHELNRLLRGATDTTFIDIGGGRPPRRQTSATSSRSTPTRACPETPSGVSSARWPIRSIGRASIAIPAGWLKVTRYCNHASRPRCRSAARGLCFNAYSQA